MPWLVYRRRRNSLYACLTASQPLGRIAMIDAEDNTTMSPSDVAEQIEELVDHLGLPTRRMGPFLMVDFGTPQWFGIHITEIK
jgi:hypothetical protein